MIGSALNFITSPLNTGVAAQAAAPANGTTNADMATDIRNTSLQTAGQLAPIASLSPSAVPAIGNSPATSNNTAQDDAPSADNPQGLSEEEQAQVDELRRIDAEVRRHEQAHMNAGGQYAGQATYTYQTGPDGGRYAVAGEVPIDTAPVPDNPQATIDKMQVVIRAALAPAEPSAQDLRVASSARQTIVAAGAELRAEERAEFEAQIKGDNRGNNLPNDTVSGLVTNVYSRVSGLNADAAQETAGFNV